MSVIMPFWSGFCARTGLTGPVPPVTAFGNPGAQQDSLAALVLAGRKRATAGLLAEYEADGWPLPQKGDLEIFTDGSATPLGVIRTTEMRVGRSYRWMQRLRRMRVRGMVRWIIGWPRIANFFARSPMRKGMRFPIRVWWCLYDLT
jgi:hypothetical protein